MLDASVEMPDTIRELLIDVRDRTYLRNQRMVSQLRELLPVLNECGVQPIVMRGAARLLGENPEKGRLLSDLDLLVPAARERDCVEALSKLGYGVGADPGSPYPTELERSCDVGAIDLHVLIQPPVMALDFERLAVLCRVVELETGRALLPSATGQVLLGIVHDQLHDADYWRGLIDVRHMVDLAQLHRDEGIDWDLLTSFFPIGTPRRALETQLRTARSLLGIDIPQCYCGPLTLLHLLIEPPQLGNQSMAAVRSTIWERLTGRVPVYLRPSASGKL